MRTVSLTHFAFGLPPKYDEQRIHWIAWNRLCSSTYEGGLGFKDFESFNLAMLAKQGWKLTTDTHSLLALSLKARYYPNGSFLTAKKGYNPSFTWQSILAGQQVLNAGIRWTIGNGTSIRVWGDPWLSHQPNFRINMPTNNENADLRVCDLMMRDEWSWDEEKILHMFPHSIAEQILRIPLRNQWSNDQYAWHYTPNGRYTVKSGYKIALSITSKTDLPSSSSSPGMLWKWIWGLSIPPKIRFFIWRAAQDRLPVNTNFLKRHMLIDPLCRRCGEEPESAEHALRDCPWSNVFWRASPLRLDDKFLSPSTATITDMLHLVSTVDNKDFENLFVTLMWSLWHSRNVLVFQGKDIPHQECFQLATRIIQEHQEQLNETVKQTSSTRNTTWRKPPPGTFKLNTDASTKVGSGTGIGAVLRDHEGKVIASLSKHLSPEYPIEIGEAIACREGINLARSIQCSNLLVEADCIQLVNGIASDQKDYSYLGKIVEDIRAGQEFFNSAPLSHISRKANTLAHSLARHAFSMPCNSQYLGPLPPDLVNIATDEAFTSQFD
ncbi:hypothetical protein DH2020_047273 [Rehmannia glutinosa]|uniref:Uncharacterized protein n=1 Tax=Rehmannia glutinosa TaxID=99300 RepID=A0ABR0U8W2_REHGL